jgi:hypothetical protein
MKLLDKSERTTPDDPPPKSMIQSISTAPALKSQAAEFLPGAALGERYRIDKELGRGGMGRVFVARDLRLDRDVALKVLATDAHGEEQVRRFEQEARAAGALNHPNIVAIHDAGNHGGAPYIVSELLHGTTLRRRLVEPLTTRCALDYALQLARGLAAAHEHGIVHRDVKPENLFITSDGGLKILDFGIAKILPIAAGKENLRDDTPCTTEAGTILGTVAYMSPEQMRGEPADQRSDVFSFGAVFSEMLSGTPAFPAASPIENGLEILNCAPPLLPATVPLALRLIVERCLEKEPEDRYPSARELAAELEELATPFVPQPKRLLMVSLALAAGALAIFIVWREAPIRWAKKPPPQVGQLANPDPRRADPATQVDQALERRGLTLDDLAPLDRQRVERGRQALASHDLDATGDLLAFVAAVPITPELVRGKLDRLDGPLAARARALGRERGRQLEERYLDLYKELRGAATPREPEVLVLQVAALESELVPSAARAAASTAGGHDPP